MKLKLFSFLFLIAICLQFAQAQGKQEVQKTESKPKLTAAQKLEYQRMAEDMLTNLDTLVQLTEEQKKQVYQLNYTYWESTHKEHTKIDSLELILNALKKEVRVKERAKNQEIKKMIPKEQMPAFRKSRELERMYLDERKRKKMQVDQPSNDRKEE